MTPTPPEDTTRAVPAAGVDLPDLPLAMTHAAMNAAYDNGDAIPLGPAVAWLTRYREAWWVVYERGWLRVTGTATAEDLDHSAARLAEAEATGGEAG
jgi:hypothetical protein